MSVSLLFVYLFIYLLAVSDLSCSMWDLSLFRTACLAVGSVIALHRLQGVQALVVVAGRLICSDTCGILVPCPGIESASPALQGRFLTTVREVPCLFLLLNVSFNLLLVTS